MGGYHQLTQDERYQVAVRVQRKESLSEIAIALNRSPSTIYRELSRNKTLPIKDYCALRAQKRARKLTTQARVGQQIVKGKLEEWVINKLRLDWSPEQIEGRLKTQEASLSVSYSTIYRYVYRKASAAPWERLHCHLRRGKRQRKRHRKLKSAFFSADRQNERVSISKRPKEVAARNRLGDYERDTLHGVKNRPPVILSIVDRRSRKLKIAHVEDRSCKRIHEETVKLLKSETVLTLTNDNGSEFTDHKKTAKSLGTNIYFCHPRCSWERGSNENTNGLIRQYFPKNMDFRNIPRAEIKKAEALLNNRPRKCLDFKTPNEVHQALSRELHLV